MSTEIKIMYDVESLLDGFDIEEEGINVEATRAKFNRRLRHEIMQVYGEDVKVDIVDGDIGYIDIEVDGRSDYESKQYVAQCTEKILNNDAWIVYETELA